MNYKRSNKSVPAAIIGCLVVVFILVFGTIWTGQSAQRDAQKAVRSVSLLYLDELAGRREQVVEANLQENIRAMNMAISLMTEEDLSDKAHMEAYQTRMKSLFNLERFAFIDENGLIYSSSGYHDNISEYPFDYKNIDGPEIFVQDPTDPDKMVVIAIPTDLTVEGNHLTSCFIAMNMESMLEGVSMTSESTDATFCNIYTKDGVALSNTVLGGLAVEDNLLAALENAEYDGSYSLEQIKKDFENGERGVVSFTYNGISETLSYVPVEGTDWMLTYLIRESVISRNIQTMTSGIIKRSLSLSILAAVVLLAVFAFIILQMRKNARLLLEKETIEAENRVKQEEMEQRLALQEKLLQQEREKHENENMIQSLSADYRSVYYLDLDKDEGVCYQSHTGIDDGFRVGDRFKYMESVTNYCNAYILEPYREEFMKFIQPEAILEALKTDRVISYRYMVNHRGKELYEMVRFAGVEHPEQGEGQAIHTVGACFADVDAETRKALAQNEALSDALSAAEEANRAKTAFLSNMCHEIRTPMNAIIGLDNIALNDPETPEHVKGYLEKIGDSAEHLLGLINDILDMSRIESGRMTLKNEEFSFSKLIEQINTIISGQCHEKGLDYQCHINGHVDDYYIGDNMKLRQMLINILGNAVKFTPEGGSVELTAECTAQYDGKSTMRFVMADTGIGISEDFLPYLFDAFAQEDSSNTNKYGSSGLGLAITKNIVEMMNGTIEVESTKGEGTTFIVTVTLMDAEKKAHDEREEEIRPQDMSVLIIDDDPIACEHARLVLEKAGIASEIAESGAEAIEMVKLRSARFDPYNLILVDWQMPEMDGVETTRQIREIVGDQSAIIILTAYRWDDVLEEALEAGVDSFISKPLFASVVLEEFKDAIKRKGYSFDNCENRADLTGRRILLAEDVEVNAEIMVMVLKMREISVEVAENGRIAVDKFTASEEGYYDAILMDMRMPEMDGLEATRTIRAMERPDAKEIPIIALTANAFDEDVQRSLQAGLNAHLSKPVQPEALFDTLEQLIKP